MRGTDRSMMGRSDKKIWNFGLRARVAKRERERTYHGYYEFYLPYEIPIHENNFVLVS